MSGRGRVFYAGAAFESPRPALTGSMMMLTKRLMRVATAIAISSPTLRALPGGRSVPPKSEETRSFNFRSNPSRDASTHSRPVEASTPVPTAK